MKLTKRILAAVLAAALALAMLTACSGTLPPSDDSGDFDVQLELYRQEVLKLINEERAKVDVEPLLRTDQDLNDAAQKRAKELSTSYSHTRPDGSSWTSVLREYSLTSYNSYDEVVVKGLDTPAALVCSIDGLVFSDKGRQDMLNGQFRQIGIGYVQDGDQYYWALIFAG